MKKETCISLIILVFALTPTKAKAEYGGFIFGYNVGVFSSAARNFQAGANEFNTIHQDNLKNEIHMSPFYRGLTFGFGMSDGGGYFGARFSSKKMLSNYGEYDDVRQKWRFRFNSISLEGAFGTEELKFGLSTEIGIARASKRVLKDGDTKLVGGWDPLYDEKVLIESGYISGSATLFMMLVVGEKFEIRPYYQFSYGTKAIAVQSLTYQRYSHSINNFGISMNLWLNFD